MPSEERVDYLERRAFNDNHCNLFFSERQVVIPATCKSFRKTGNVCVTHSRPR